MSFLRHGEIFPNDQGVTPSGHALAHRPDESPVGYSSAGCSPAWPASALPTGLQCALNSCRRSTDFHRTANCVLTVCLTPGGRPKERKQTTEERQNILQEYRRFPIPKLLDLVSLKIVWEWKTCLTILKLAHYGIGRYRRRAFARYFLQFLRHIDRRARRTVGIRGKPSISTRRTTLDARLSNLASAWRT
jgi:hypothetical protein